MAKIGQCDCVSNSAMLQYCMHAKVDLVVLDNCISPGDRMSDEDLIGVHKFETSIELMRHPVIDQRLVWQCAGDTNRTIQLRPMVVESVCMKTANVRLLSIGILKWGNYPVTQVGRKILSSWIQCL